MSTQFLEAPSPRSPKHPQPTFRRSPLSHLIHPPVPRELYPFSRDLHHISRYPSTHPQNIPSQSTRDSRPVPCPAHCLEVLPLPEGLSGILPGHASSLSLLSGHGASGAGPTLVWCPMNQCWPRALSGSRAQEVPARPLPVAPCLERAARVPRTSWQVSQSTPERPTGSSHAETLQTVTVPTTQGTSGWTC